MMPNPGPVPIMTYVRELEDKIRKYQREEIRSNRTVFWYGFFTGSVIMSAFWVWVMIRGKG